MSASETSLLLVIPIREQDDLLPVVESEGWYTVKDLFKKTGTSYNTHWNGNYVVDQDEIPWKATEEELNSLAKISGRVIVLSGATFNISESLPLFADSDGSVYVRERDLEGFFD